MKILQTSNYELFDTLVGNRVINEKKVKNLLSDIEGGLNLLPYCPIIVTKAVDGKLLILDGQHRFTACVRIEHQIHYVIAQDISLRDLARLNSRQDKWSSKDFLKCYIEIGVEGYQELKDFMKKYHLNFSTAVSLLMWGSSNSTDAMNTFRDGNLKINHLELSTKVMDLIEEIFGRYIFSTNRYFIAAILQIIEADKIDWQRMKEKIKQNANILDFQASKKSYIRNLEELYNYRNQKRDYLV